VGNSSHPQTAPALIEPVFEVFWNTEFSVTGLFYACNATYRVTHFPPSSAGGFANNPNTYYESTIYALKSGQMFVIRGKLPTHPRTRRGETTWMPQNPQVQYFSVTTGAAPSWGAAYDTVYDEQIQTNKHGYYTIVVSISWNKPSRDALNNGTIWLNPGLGEGPYIGARDWLGFVYIRYQNPSSTWKESPANIPMPSLEHPEPLDPIYMKEYYPVGIYMTKEEFEKSWPLWFEK
jgi:hypothetical protein